MDENVYFIRTIKLKVWFFTLQVWCLGYRYSSMSKSVYKISQEIHFVLQHHKKISLTYTTKGVVCWAWCRKVAGLSQGTGVSSTILLSDRFILILKWWKSCYNRHYRSVSWHWRCFGEMTLKPKFENRGKTSTIMIKFMRYVTEIQTKLAVSHL